MGVELIKDRYGEDRFVISNEDFYDDKKMGENFSDFDTLKIINSNNYKIVTKVYSKKNSKIYVRKKIDCNINQINQKDINEEFEKLKSLDHHNIVKYYKSFIKDNSLYFIEQYIDNGGLDNLVVAYESLNKPIETKLLWNIFMQCISGLKYLHDKDIIHKNICIENILMNENTEIKLDDIQFSFILDEEKKDKGKPEDIYDMSQVFTQLMPEKYKDEYPDEMKDIINSMENDYNEENTDYFFNKIMEQYIKNVAKVSSIYSVFKCISCFPGFKKSMEKNKNIFIENESVGYYLKEFMFNVNLKHDDIIMLCNKFRNLLYKNSQKNNDIEIKPKQVLEFLLERLNKEQRKNRNGPSFKNLPKILTKIKLKAFEEFKENFNKNYQSDITDHFILYMKKKRVCKNITSICENCLNNSGKSCYCKKCRNHVYSFSACPFIELNMDLGLQDIKIRQDGLEKIVKLDTLENWFYAQNFYETILNKEHKFVCLECQEETEQKELNQFYILPSCFIISLNRGKNNSSNFKIPLEINLEKMVERKDYPCKFELIGIVQRYFQEKEGEKFVAVYKDQNEWKKYDKEEEEINIDKTLSENDNGLPVMLFYLAKFSSGIGE